MSTFDRENTYIQLLSERNFSVKELANKLFVSEPTVRRDIVKISKKGILDCSNGVVSLNVSSPDSRIPLFLRELEQNEEKISMAKTAVTHIKNGCTIMLDASSSAYHIISYLKDFKNIFVITSGIKAAIALATLNIRCVCTGGDIISESYSLTGNDAQDVLSRYNADIAFFSCRGLSNEGLITDNSILENNIRRIMIKKSKRSYLLCDKKKIGNTYLNTLCHKDDIDGVITN